MMMQTKTQTQEATMSYRNSYTHGMADTTHDTLQQAMDEIASRYPDAVYYTPFGHEAVDADHAANLGALRDERGEQIIGRILLAWEDEALSVNDDGTHAVAEITYEA